MDASRDRRLTATGDRVLTRDGPVGNSLASALASADSARAKLDMSLWEALVILIDRKAVPLRLPTAFPHSTLHHYHPLFVFSPRENSLSLAIFFHF